MTQKVFHLKNSITLITEGIEMVIESGTRNLNQFPELAM